MRILSAILIFLMTAQAAWAACALPGAIDGNLVLGQELDRAPSSSIGRMQLSHPLDPDIRVRLEARAGRALSSMDRAHLRKVLQLEVREQIKTVRQQPSDVVFHGGPEYGWTGTWRSDKRWQQVSRVWVSGNCRLTAVVDIPARYAGSAVAERIAGAITSFVEISMEGDGYPRPMRDTWRPSGMDSVMALASGIGLVLLGVGTLHATRFHAFTYLSLYEKTLAGLLLVIPSGWVAIRTTGLIIDRASLEQLEIALLNMGVFVGGIAWFLWCYRRQAVYSLSMQSALVVVHAGYLYKGWVYDTFAGKIAVIGHVAALIGLLILFRHARTRQKFEKGARTFLARLD